MNYEDGILMFARTMRELQGNVERRIREQQKGEAFVMLTIDGKKVIPAEPPSQSDFI